MSGKPKNEDLSEAVQSVCRALQSGRDQDAANIIHERCPFAPPPVGKRRPTKLRLTSLFVRDGFVDRYTGTRLIFPPVLRLIHVALPDAFPFHPNWKVDETHMAVWALFPTYDHVHPVSRGGADDDGNLVTASMRSNAAKAHWTLDELSWSLKPRGNMRDWDGMLGWFFDYVLGRPQLLAEHSYVAGWHAAAVDVMAKG